MTFPFLDGTVSSGTVFLLLVSLGIALGFEFVNGFHDTANAVATVIYTRSLPPRTAVVWSGIWNFIGVHLGGIGVAYSIVNLLPVELLVNIESGPALSMVLSLLLASLVWNLGTWYVGIPCSSSHTLIGAILGVGLAESLYAGRSFGAGVNWAKAGEVLLSLLLSPILGFCLAALLLLVFRFLAPSEKLHSPPPPEERPPWWIRAVLVLTCTGVSVAHGSNDGQKGIGLIMLILIGLLPVHFAVNLKQTPEQLSHNSQVADDLHQLLGKHADEGQDSACPDLPEIRQKLRDIHDKLANSDSLRQLSLEGRWQLRSELLEAGKELKEIEKRKCLHLSEDEERHLQEGREQLLGMTEYAPTWVKLAVATALGVGTMIGWKRIVVTVGEKIGSTHLTYAQGAAAEIVAASTIGLADIGGMPVSTTHVLSSGVAGTMAASGSSLQRKTVRNILIAWVLTLPAAMLLSGGLAMLLRWIVS